MEREILNALTRPSTWVRMFACVSSWVLLALLFPGCHGTTLYGVLRDNIDQGRSFAADTVRISTIDRQWSAIVVPDPVGNWKYKKGKAIRVVGDPRTVNLKKDSLNVIAEHVYSRLCKSKVGTDTLLRCVSTATYAGRIDSFKKENPRLMMFDADVGCNCPDDTGVDIDNKDIK